MGTGKSRGQRLKGLQDLIPYQMPSGPVLSLPHFKKKTVAF